MNLRNMLVSNDFPKIIVKKVHINQGSGIYVSRA